MIRERKYFLFLETDEDGESKKQVDSQDQELDNDPKNGELDEEDEIVALLLTR